MQTLHLKGRKTSNELAAEGRYADRRGLSRYWPTPISGSSLRLVELHQKFVLCTVKNVAMCKSEQLTTIPIPVGFGTGAAEIESISTTSSRSSQSPCVEYLFRSSLHAPPKIMTRPTHAFEWRADWSLGFPGRLREP